ncbi:FHA domain-containing protein [Streptomyces sp. MS2A]|nr:FHA domain-containing protein [Streptomyces sp. MS2A]
MPITAYHSGTWYLLVGPRAVVALPPDADAGLVAEVWRRASGEEAAFADIVDALTAAGGGSFAAIPPFGAVVLEGTDATIRIAVRGRVSVRFAAADGEQEASGAEVTTWSERVAGGVHGFELRTAEEPGAEDEALPIVAGVVRGALFRHGEIARPDDADAAVSADGSIDAQDAAPLDEPEPEPEPEHDPPGGAPADEEVPDSEPSATTAFEPADEPVDEPVDPADEPVADALADEPAAEEPVADEPAAEEPVADELPEPPAPVDDSPEPVAVPEDEPREPVAPVDGPTDTAHGGFSSVESAPIDTIAVADPETVADPEGSSPPADPEPAGDHDGATISVAQARELRGAEAPVPPAPAVPAPVVSAPAPVFSFSPAVLPDPRTAPPSSPVAPSDAATEAIPTSATGPRLVLSTGQIVTLDRPAVIGRRPRSPRATGATLPHLIAVESPQHDISRSHLEVRPEPDAVVVVDLHATNGSTLLRPGVEPVRLHPGEPTVVVTGDVIDLGDGVTVRFEDLP